MSAVSLGLKMLKIGMSAFIENDLLKNIAGELADAGIDRVEQFCEKYIADINHLLSLEDEEMEKQNIPQEKRAHIRENIKEFIRTVNLDEIADKCQYDEAKLGDILAEKYKDDYQQDTEKDYKYYRRMLRSLANYALQTIKSSKEFDQERILDCYRLLTAMQEQQVQDEAWKKSVSDLLGEIIKLFHTPISKEDKIPRVFTVLAPRPPEYAQLISRVDIQKKILSCSSFIL